jgi:hypothetical protein
VSEQEKQPLSIREVMPIGFSSPLLRIGYAAFILSILMAILTIRQIINALRK